MDTNSRRFMALLFILIGILILIFCSVAFDKIPGFALAAGAGFGLVGVFAGVISIKD